MADQDSITWDYINIILNNTPRAIDRLLLHLEGTGNIPEELSEFFGRDAIKSNAYRNQSQTMTKLEAIADLKQLFDNITSCLGNAKKEGGHLWWFPIMLKFNRYTYHTIGGVKNQRAGQLSSHIGLLDNKLQDILDISREKSCRSWKHKFDMTIHTHKEGSMTWAVL